MNTSALEHALLYSNAQEVVKIRCPVCGGGISATYVPHGKKAVGAGCPSCRWDVWLDGLDTEPPWVSRIGNNLETG